jgi:multisubunit Na+/H+ antiporter MnhC subunit
MSVYLLCLVLFGLGVYCMLVKRNIIKIIVGSIIAETAVNLFLVLAAYRVGGIAPILGSLDQTSPMVDPLPQAMVLTAIVIGLATTALMVAIALRVHEKYGTYDIDRIRELRG